MAKTLSEIEQLIEKVATEYGIPTWVARGIAYGENSAFNPSQVTAEPNGTKSVGIFQVNDVNEPSVEKRQNAEWNIRWAMENSVGPAYKAAIAAGLTQPADILQYIWQNGQRAADYAIPGAVQRASAYLGDETTDTGLPQLQSTAGLPPVLRGATQPMALQTPPSASQAGGGLTAEQSRTMGLEPYTTEEMRVVNDLAHLVEIGGLEEAQAWKILDEWRSTEDTRTQRAQVATTRGGEELTYRTNLLSKVLPTPTLPMTGPGGLGDILSKRYGIPDITPAFPGTPISGMPSAQQVFGQYNEQMGLPANMGALQPPNLGLPNWGALGQAMPTFGQGGNAYIDALLKEGRTTAPNLG